MNYSELLKRAEAEEIRMLKLYDHAVLLRDKWKGNACAYDLNGMVHAVSGRDPVLTELAAAIRSLQAKLDAIQPRPIEEAPQDRTGAEAMTKLTLEEVNELSERSKDDKAIIVGSEIRQLCQLARERLQAGTFQQGLEAAAKKAKSRIGAITRECDYLSPMDPETGSYECSKRGDCLCQERDEEAEAIEAAIRNIKPEVGNG